MIKAMYKKITILVALCCSSWQLYPMMNDDSDQQKVIEFCVNSFLLGSYLKSQQQIDILTFEKLDKFLENLERSLGFLNVSSASLIEMEGVLELALETRTVEEKIEELRKNINSIYSENATTISIFVKKYDIEDIFSILWIENEQ